MKPTYLGIENLDLGVNRMERVESLEEAVSRAKALAAQHPLTTVTGFDVRTGRPVFFVNRAQEVLL